MGTITTHVGGPFYNWYVQTYGYGPPATVNDQAARYLAWQQGIPRDLARFIPYGAIGQPGIYIAGTAPIAVLAPSPPPIAPIGQAGGAILPPTPSAPPPVAVLEAPPAASEPPPVAVITSPTTIRWWAVVASRESLGGIGACRPIEPRGYSELSNDPAARDFRALGGLACLTGLYLRNPGNGNVVGAVKQDVGAGSSFLPSMGLYPQTIADLGMDPTAGEYHIEIRRQDGGAMNIPRGAAIDLPFGTAPATPSGGSAQVWFNPLAHAAVTPERIDQGVDYAGSGYLVAITDAVITASVANGSGWEGEGYLEYRIIRGGELAGAYVYYAEGIDPIVSVGDTVKGGQHIANLRQPMPHGIELGFAAGTNEESYYRYHDGAYAEGTATRPGIAFSNLIERLGGPGGKIEGAVVGRFPEYMQSGVPDASINTAGVAASPLATNQPKTGAQGAAGDFKFPDDYYSAFVQLQRGANNASHHSHAAAAYAAGVTFVTKAD